MKILKFGGSSIKDADRIRKVLDIVIRSKQENGNIAVVFSALGGVTDDLIEMSKRAALYAEDYIDRLNALEKRHFDIVNELISVKNRGQVLTEVKLLTNELADVLQGVYLVKELTPKTLDFIMSFGERLSAFIITEALRDIKFPASYLDTRQIIKTDENFGKANVDKTLAYQNIARHFNNSDEVQIITGFIGSTQKNETTTLGRGGSDYTASLFAAALKVSELEIWTDVNGVLSADPGKVKNAFSIPEMTYEEAMEMSHFGAKVIYPPTMLPVLKERIPIRIRNTLNPEFTGTVIHNRHLSTNGMLIKGISSISKVSLLRVQGSGIIGVAGFAARLFGALAKEKINIILITQASSEHSICMAIEPGAAIRAKSLIEEEFHLEIRANLLDEVAVENDLTIVAIVGEHMRKTPGIASRLFQALGNGKINVVAIAQGSSELNISVVINQTDETKALNIIHHTFFNL
ncbi:hypothetical protein B6D60_11960 [candidate division KSB1 bacterium 4484_87]|nr:MAG: hypothetical protein B6D60_11960 [candidate division KSB1 bacterium 4484_87]